MCKIKYEIGDIVTYAGNDYFVVGFPIHSLFDITILPIDSIDFFGDVDIKSKINLTMKSKMVKMVNVIKK